MTASGPYRWNSTFMTRETGLTRTPFAPRGKPIPRTPQARVRSGRAGNGKSAPAKKKGGNSGPTPKVREMVLKRDGYRCTCGCNRSIIGQRYSLGHRLRASQGGKPVPSNLLTFLGWGGEKCHGRIDSRRDPCDEANGMTVRSGRDPAQVPVRIAIEGGSRVTVWLWDDGEYHFDGPQGPLGAIA